MSIQILSAQLANQIAAGEVVERPASVIKELVENSIDAGATDIVIEIDQGGHKRMLIRDNGKGIHKDDLSLALSRHATSKITELADLEAITSLGFRGEALASISSVSRLTLTSKTAEQTEAWQAHSEGRDMQVLVHPAAHPQGTSVEVLDLFFNTPARRKFLKAAKTEFQHIEETIKRIALANHQVSFSLKHNGKQIHRYANVADELSSKRIASVCGQNFIDSSVKVLGEYQHIHVSGWCSAMGQGRATNDLQYSFVNGRMMRDRVILHAIRQAFEGMIDAQTYPAFVIFINMPADQLDVNVHPAKHEVRFHQSRQVHDLIFQSISDAILSSQQRLENDSSSSAISTLEHQLTHAYSQPTDSSQEPSRDYVAPLQSSSTQSRFSSTPRYTAQHPSKAEVNAYNNILQVDTKVLADLPSTWLIAPNATLVSVHEEQLLALPQYLLAAAYVKDKLQHSDTSQPLLMPVSLSAPALHAEQLAIFNDMGFEIAHMANKLILKKVPACLRQLPWLSIFPQLVSVHENLHNSQQCIDTICYYWMHSKPAPTELIQRFVDTIGEQVFSTLWRQHASTLTVPEASKPFE